MLGGYCGGSRLILEDLGRMAVLCGVTLQCGYPRNVVELERIFDIPCRDDIRMLVESARGEPLMVRRCLNLVVNRQLSLFNLVW